MSAISEQYAVALFELSNEKNIIETINDDFTAFIKTLDESTMRYFKHPGIEKKDKKSIIQSLDQQEIFNNFLCVLIENNRFTHLQSIKQSFDTLLDEMHKRMNVAVFSKKALNKSKLNALKEEYENKYNRQVTIQNYVDETIIGGLRFEFDGKVIDHTVNNTLHQLKSRLTK